jgi:hypothetical protein
LSEYSPPESQISDEPRVTVESIPYGDPRRLQARDLAHRLICPAAQAFDKYGPDYNDAFVVEKQYRVLAAFDAEDKMVGSCAYFEVPRGIYCEFLATEPDSQAGKPLIDNLRDQVFQDSKKAFVVLCCIPADRNDKGSMHTYAWYLNQRFSTVDHLPTMNLLTELLSPRSKKVLTAAQIYTRFKIPKPCEGTEGLIWIKPPPRPGSRAALCNRYKR